MRLAHGHRNRPEATAPRGFPFSRTFAQPAEGIETREVSLGAVALALMLALAGLAVRLRRRRAG